MTHYELRLPDGVCVIMYLLSFFAWDMEGGECSQTEAGRFHPWQPEWIVGMPVEIDVQGGAVRADCDSVRAGGHVAESGLTRVTEERENFPNSLVRIILHNRRSDFLGVAMGSGEVIDEAGIGGKNGDGRVLACQKSGAEHFNPLLGGCESE